jgi:hypothetical protein
VASIFGAFISSHLNNSKREVVAATANTKSKWRLNRV